MRIARPLVAALGAFALLLPASTPASAADVSGNLPVPETITALGDSITAGVHVNRLLVTEPAYSWSTGTNTTVNSLYWQLEKLETGTMGVKNLSKSGAKAANLQAQAASAMNNPGSDLVTILIGANDACTSNANVGTASGNMTPTDVFRTQIDSALIALEGKGVEHVAIASIPDIYKLWSVYKGSSSARFTWGLYKICQSMLANPSNTTLGGADDLRRQKVRLHVQALNAQLAAACLAASERRTLDCRFDDYKVFNTTAATMTTNDVSKADYFHPSPSGQKKLAEAAFAAFWPPSPPTP